MNYTKLLYGITVGVVLGIGAQLYDVPQAQARVVMDTKKSGTKIIIYSPSSTGKPTRQVKQGARGTCDKVPSAENNFALRVLVPESTGKTLEAQPTLYWWVSKPMTATFAFTFGEMPAADSFEFSEPLIRTQFQGKNISGIQALSLKKHNVSLKQGVEYEWSISLVCDPKNRSLDITAQGTIMRVAPSAELASERQRTGEKDLPYFYAKNGLWYDALSTLSNLIQKNPKAKNLRQVRASLLEQGNLPKVAATEGL